MAAPTKTAPAVTVTNPNFLSCLLKLGDVLHCALHVQVTFVPPPAPAMGGARIAVTPVKRAEYDAFPELAVADEWREDLYASTDNVAQLWVGFYHMIEERMQGRIFGGRYASAATLYDKLGQFFGDYSRGRPVSIFLSDFFAADEFYCATSPGNTLADALDRLRQLANEWGMRAYEFVWRDVRAVPAAADVVDARDEAGRDVRVWEARWGVYRVEGVAGPDRAVREALLYYLQSLHAARGSNTPLEPGRLWDYDDCYVWHVSVSELSGHVERLLAGGDSASGLCNGTHAAHKPDVAGAALRHYATLAGAVWYYTWRRVAALLPVLGSVPEALYLRFVHDFSGPGIAARIAAVGSTPTPQRQVSGLGVSAFAQAHAPEPDTVPIAGTVAALRDVGRLPNDDNVVRPPLMTALRALVLTDGPRAGTLTPAEHEPALVKPGRLADGTRLG